jgi:hypothetical protein
MQPTIVRPIGDEGAAEQRYAKTKIACIGFGRSISALCSNLVDGELEIAGDAEVSIPRTVFSFYR